MRDLKRIRLKLVRAGAALTVIAPLGVGSGFLLFREPAVATSQGSWRLAREGLRAAGREDLSALCQKLRLCPPASGPEGARARAAVLHEIGLLRTPESRAFLVRLAQDPSSELIERLAAVSALGNADEASALGEVAATTSDALVRAKVVAVRKNPHGQRGGKA